ncbi:phosphopantetheine-binding protein [Pseudomonas cremoricolorata]|uniref:phosphopantetheine-binding protein n=1 Tax=Pseudomonas cremoricolorata TaxID=157783 RepID=UPI0004123541|nr:phosphopantetheine-binding protein [Pseudomonas cremoricolorata]
MTTVDSVFSIVRELILELKDVDESDVTLDASIEAMEFDSLDFVEMQVVVQKKIGVALDPDAFANRNITTLRQVCELVVELAEPVEATA